MTRNSRLDVALIMAGLCGTGACSTTPPTAPTPTQPALIPGSYLLTLSAVTAANVPQPCQEASLLATSVSIPVQVTGGPPVWTIQPDAVADLGFRGRLEAMGAGASGTMSGAAQEPGSGIVVTVSDIPSIPDTSLPGFPVVLLGRIESPRVAAGSMSGQVRFTYGGSARRCIGNEWRLVAR
jgi:hypothetical protein